MSLSEYNLLIQPLTDLLERVYVAAGVKNTKQMAATVLLADVGWNETSVEA